MRAAVFKGAGTPLVVENISDPTPGPKDAIIKLKRYGVVVRISAPPRATLVMCRSTA